MSHKTQHQKSSEPEGDDLRIIDVTQKTIAVVGKETSHLKDHLKELGGEYDRKHRGYSFPVSKRSDLEKFISIQMHEGNDHGASSSAGASSKQTQRAQGLPQEIDEGVLRTQMKASQGASDQQSSTASVAGSKQESPYIVHHSARTIAVIGAPDEFKDSFLEHGGKFNKAIKIGDEKVAGWTFAHKDLDTVKAILPDAPVQELHEGGDGGGGGGGDVSPRESAGSSSAPKDTPAAVAGKRKAATASRKETSAQASALEQAEEEDRVEAPEDVEEAEEGAQVAGAGTGGAGKRRGVATGKRKATSPAEGEEGGSQAQVTAQEA